MRPIFIITLLISASMGLSVGEDKSNTLTQRTPNGYNHLAAAIAEIGVEIPMAKTYATVLEEDVLNAEGAAKAGNIAEMSRALRNFANDLVAGAHAVQPNPELYHLARESAPTELEQLATNIDTGVSHSLLCCEQ
jgi:pyruvate formate-lyase activating enzyme-like uncharacterized protein